MVKKPYLAKSNGIGFRNFGHKQGIQVRRRNPCSRAVEEDDVVERDNLW